MKQDGYLNHIEPSKQFDVVANFGSASKPFVLQSGPNTPIIALFIVLSAATKRREDLSCCTSLGRVGIVGKIH